MDTALKIGMAVIVGALILAAIASISTFADEIIGPGQGGVTALQGHSAGGSYYAYRDQEIIMGQGGAAVEMSPADVVGWVSSMLFPVQQLSPSNARLGGWEITESSPIHRGWIIALIGGVPAVLGVWIGLKWLFGFLFGAD